MADKNPTAIVTGSATGIGAATALKLAGRGWNVLVNCTKSLTEAEETAAKCVEAGGKALVCAGDVAVDADCKRIVTVAVKQWGRLDALVNNAAITKFVPLPDLDGLTAEDFQRLYAVNVIGAFQMARAAAPHLKKSGRGAIVNVSSQSSRSGAGSSIAYVITKGAMDTLTMSLARVLAPEIRVNTVLPGFIPTRWSRRVMSEDAFAHLYGHFESTTPLRKVTKPEDIADAVVWFIDGAGAVTGQSIIVDSGNHLHVNSPPRRK